MDCDQSPNEMTQTVHNFPKLDLILKLAYNVNLCSYTWRAFDMFLDYYVLLQELCQKLQLHVSLNPQLLGCFEFYKLCIVFFFLFTLTVFLISDELIFTFF